MFEGKLVDLTRRRKGGEAPSCEVGVSPVCEGEALLDARRGGEGMSCPGEESVALGDHPIRCSVEVEDGEGGGWGFCGYESGYWCRRGYALVEEGDAEEGAP